MIFDAAAFWWRADAPVTVDGWADRKSGALLAPVAGTLPTTAASAAYNNQSVVNFPTGAACLVAANVLPIQADYSVVVVGRSGPDPDNSFLVGNGAAATNDQSRVTHTANGEISFTPSGASPFTESNRPGYSRPANLGPNMILASYDASAALGQIRLNRGAFSGRTLIAVPNGSISSQFNVNGTGPTGGTGRIDGGEIAEVIVFHTAILKAPELPLCNAIEVYLGERYGFGA
ncbi:hypothetical protein [Brevundimonas nasdae]|uniref:hypothetical protein n=1 Tax=Brevundimonas nasdae TaxID=172043 RepID=UPI003F68CFFF